ncbi:SMP-30/gluconolactonase/LRE family protein [Pseudohoeflea coraliihabitans]|uniref:SMP-30/gluconolactonase/LRE family protein n=1 Tax=Pseudohoeflea coraliihabitans TaxID=2860393 RepID=A0ABS6WL06_9HYPH|nr:SMP-30/gluconolactonase/LRE family protein [Pseudohoeflea sp. DP4N28-3]
MPEVHVLTDTPDILGEGPQWNAEDGRLYWVDAFAPAIRRIDPETRIVESFAMPCDIGSFVFARGGGLVAGMRSGFNHVELAGQTVTPIVNPLGDDPRLLLNDGKCDRAGRYWCASAHSDFLGRSSVLYRLDGDFSVRQMDDGFIIGNGIAFSPDDSRMYFADSRDEKVWVYDFELASGAISNRRLFFSTAEIEGRVDGATCDRDGNYWCALVHGAAVACLSPKGEMIAHISVPAKHPTMVTFGGADMRSLYVTTATAMLTENERSEWPEAGKLLRIDGTGAQGIVEPRFDHNFTEKKGAARCQPF